MPDRKMLINVTEPEEIRIAVLEDGKLEELYVERASQEQLVGNIYKAKVVNVEQSLEAAFVDFGGARNGFLHATDVAPSYQGDKKGRAPLQTVLHRGQDLMVQVTREGIGKKAPRVTTYVSVPGRYLVLMPEIKRQGVSKKIQDEEERQKLKDMLQSLNPPADMGFIIRTAGEGRVKRDLQRDMSYLLRLWRAVQNRFKNTKGPGMLYQESDLVKRAVRDIFSTDMTELLIDSEEEYKAVMEFVKITMPRQRGIVKLYSDPEPLFHKHRLEEEIEKIYQRAVQLEHGGSIVLDQTEALVAIDVNSGRYVSESSAEETAFKTNMKAADEIARQIRLRDLGGVMVIDFIDMETEEHRHEVEQAFWNAMKGDRARVKMLHMSRFGIVEMTRQRMRESLGRTHYDVCPCCRGTGRIKTPERVGLDAFRQIKSRLQDKRIGQIEATLHPRVADYLQNEKRADLLRLEKDTDVRIQIVAAPDAPVDKVELVTYDKEGNRLKS